MRIADGVLWKAGYDPGKVAVRTTDEALTYGELAAGIHNVGQAFRALGGRPGDVVALHLENSVTYLELFLGLAHAGFVVAPMNPRLTVEENDAILQQMRPWRVIVHRDDGLWVTSSLSPDSDGISLEEIRSLCHTGTEARSLDEGLSDDDVFYLGYSSGTTGAPKGLLRTHRSWTESFFGMTLEFQMNESTILLVPGPLCYSASLISALHVLFIGGTVELQRRFNPALTAQRLNESDVNAIFMVPAMYRSVLDVCEESPQWATDKPLTCVTAGDKMPVQTRSAWQSVYPGARMYEYFGSSEVGFVSVCPPSDNPSVYKSVGRPFFPARIRIVNDEIQVKSGMGFAGYVGDAKLLEQNIRRRDGFLAPGDLGYLDEQGYLHVTGRAADLIICGGVNVYPAEIEQVVLQYEGVREVCVFGMPDDRLGEVPVCVVVWEPGIGAANAELGLRQYLSQHLAGYKRPRRVWSLDKLPRNAAGKVARRELREWFSQHMNSEKLSRKP
jgi:long-chain acyl-CoA synthetase